MHCSEGRGGLEEQVLWGRCWPAAGLRDSYWTDAPPADSLRRPCAASGAALGRARQPEGGTGLAGLEVSCLQLLCLFSRLQE